MSVQEALEQFQAIGVWNQLSKAQLINDMTFRVHNPLTVNQNSAPLCGPAAIVYELVKKQPLRYVQICQNILKESLLSRARWHAHQINLRNSQVRTGMSSADWILMATMRESENLLFKKLDANSGDIALGITTPWEMKDWAHQILGYTDVDFESTVLFGEFDAMRKAEWAMNNGGVAFLMVHSAMMRNEAPTLDHPNHWVTFLGAWRLWTLRDGTQDISSSSVKPGVELGKYQSARGHLKMGFGALLPQLERLVYNPPCIDNLGNFYFVKLSVFLLKGRGCHSKQSLPLIVSSS